MALKITIETIPHNKQRYPTVGDWWYGADASIHIAVSDMGDWKKEAAVALHELAEMLMCKACHVSPAEVDAFDTKYEENRAFGDLSEPGDHPLAPYRRQHIIATTFERVFAAELGLDWNEYNEKVELL